MLTIYMDGQWVNLSQQAVDVECPIKLHDTHENLPFMPEKMEINKVKKLIPNLCQQEKICGIHSELSIKLLKHGLVLNKVHRVISFQQSGFMKVYIDKNTEAEEQSNKNKEGALFKLMNNSMFGKTMENIRKHKNIWLVTNETKYKKLVMKPNFKDGRKFSENLMDVEMGKSKIKMTKVVYLGQTLLNLSKMVMYEFHYNYMLSKYGDDDKRSIQADQISTLAWGHYDAMVQEDSRYDSEEDSIYDWSEENSCYGSEDIKDIWLGVPWTSYSRYTFWYAIIRHKQNSQKKTWFIFLLQ